MGVGADRHVSLDLMVRFARWNPQVGLGEEAGAWRQDHAAADLLVHGPLGEVQADRRDIPLRLAALVIVDLEEHVATGRQGPSRARGRPPWHPARRPAPELAGGEERQAVSPPPVAAARGL